MAETGARFDAAGWHYLDTLARRAAAHEGSVRRMLEEKHARAAAAFAERFARARATAAEVLAAASEAHPQAAAELQRLFEDDDFKGVRRLQATLDARAQCAALTELVARLEPAVATSPIRELKTVRESRATWAKLSVDRQMSKAIKLAPQNAGPINSHMLVVRSLAMMQDIAPDYLSRMMSYADTLLALDPGEKEVPAKRKKAAPAKSAKPAKAARK